MNRLSIKPSDTQSSTKWEVRWALADTCSLFLCCVVIVEVGEGSELEGAHSSSSLSRV